MTLPSIPGLIGALIGLYLGVMISGALGYWLVGPYETRARGLSGPERLNAERRALLLRRVVMVASALALMLLGYSFGRSLAGLGLSTPPQGG